MTFGLHHLPLPGLLLLPLLLAAIAPLSSSRISGNVVIPATEHANSAARASPWTLPPAVQRPVIGSLDVLVFQTSLRLCFTRLIRPPRFHEPPFHTIIATPTASGTYPVILFKHGFVLANCYYTQLFEAVASSGYIIVAPQAVTLDPDTTEEIEETARMANWVSDNLEVVLAAAVSGSDVVPDISKLVMAGHSRGGKIAFAMALGMSSTDIPSFSALITLDPVDGTSYDSILEPPIVEYGCNHTRNQLSIPVVILGTEYGSDTGIAGAPACAPACCSHMAYFRCSSAPTMYYAVALEQGHLDFLDDSQMWTGALCKSGKSKAPLRELSAELIVGFLEDALQRDNQGMHSFMESWKSASLLTFKAPQMHSLQEPILL